MTDNAPGGQAQPLAPDPQAQPSAPVGQAQSSAPGFDLAGARAAGASNAQIADYLAPKRGFDLAGARAAGASDDQIADYLAAKPAPPPAPAQSQAGADLASIGQGLVGGSGAVVAGAGRMQQAASVQSANRLLASLDLVDQGKNADAFRNLPDLERAQLGAYSRAGPDAKAAQRADLQQTVQDYDKPNTLTQAGMDVESAAPALFPVDPANEGIQTGIGRMVGGIAPAAVAGLAGGPAGMLGALAIVGTQAYDGAYQDAISKGASHADADAAAGKSALAQAAATVLPVGRLLQMVPVPLRDGLAATLVNLGQHGIELGGANALGTFAQNYVASQTYDPDRPLTQGIAQAGLEGAVAGLIIRGAGTAVAAARAPAADAVAAIGTASNVDGAIAAAAKASQAPGQTETAPSTQTAQPSFGDLFSQPTGADAGAGTASREQLQLKADADAKYQAYRAALDAFHEKWAGKQDLSVRDASQKHDELEAISPLLNASEEADAAHEQANAAPAGQVGAPAPQSVGAAASSPGTAEFSTADMKANRYQAEMGEILAPPQANDTRVIVPGSLPTLAEYSGDPVTSQAENLVRQRNPGAFIGDGKRLTENNNARVQLYEDNSPSRTTQDMMKDDRDAQWTADARDLLPNAKPADLTPAMDWVQEQLSDPKIQENDDVRSVLENFRDRLTDDDGDLKTDPAALWGIHDNLQNQLAKAKNPLNATGAEKYAQSQLLAAKQVIDDALNVSTDNHFQTALDNYAKASQAINAAELLDAFRPKLTNSAGVIMADRFHNFVKGLATLRGNPGIDPAMSISDGTMRAMINIDTDLKRAGLIKLGAAAGSPTNLLGALAESMGLGAAHLAAGHIAGPIGNLVLNAGVNAVTGKLGKYRLDKLTEKHLAPPPGGYKFPEPEEPPATAAPALAGRQVAAPAPGDLLSQPQRPAPAPPAAPPAEPPPAPVMPRAAAGAGPGNSVAFTPSGAAVPVRYTVRDASDLIASQLADGRTNPAFPAALQPRDRTRAASIQQVNSIANRLEPERLGASASTSEGAPIVGPDGVVESGNGRTLAIMQAYADGGPRADAYRQWVAAQGHDTGRMQNPVLVRERQGDLDMTARARLAADMGASPIAAMSAPERAAADARAIPTDVLSLYQGGDVTLAKNAAFARAFAEHVVPHGEHAGFITADGEMSADGAIRVRNALTQRAYGSNSLVTSLAENADPDIKAFGGALMDAAGSMAKLRGAIDSGAVAGASDIAPDIVAAAQLIQTARRQRISLADAVGQRDAFSVLPEQTEVILQTAFGDGYAGRMSRARMADFFSAYSANAQMQSGLFGANQTAGEMLAAARAQYGYGTKTGTKAGVPAVSGSSGAGLDFNRPQARGPADDPAGHGDAGTSPAGNAGGAETPDEVTPPLPGLINTDRRKF